MTCKPCEAARLGRLKPTKFPPFSAASELSGLGVLSPDLKFWAIVGTFTATGAASALVIGPKKGRLARAAINAGGFGLVGFALAKVIDLDASAFDKTLIGGAVVAGGAALYFAGSR